MNRSPDVVIIGSGMGGATLAASLAPTGAEIVILERGEQIPDDAPARDADVSTAEEDCFAPENSCEDDAEKFAEHQRKFAAADDDITDEEFNALFGT